MVVLATASATHTSRWYVTSAFTTFFAISLLIYANPAEGASRFNERVLETVLGVGLAYLFGLVIPLRAGEHGSRIDPSVEVRDCAGTGQLVHGHPLAARRSEARARPMRDLELVERDAGVA